jgi:hypothetical protein
MYPMVHFGEHPVIVDISDNGQQSPLLVCYNAGLLTVKTYNTNQNLLYMNTNTWIL